MTSQFEQNYGRKQILWNFVSFYETKSKNNIAKLVGY